MTLFHAFPALAVAVIVVVEVVKALLARKAYMRSADGNALGQILALEGITFAADAAVVCLTVFPYDASHRSAVFAVCGAFLISRVVSSLALSRVLRK